LNKIKLIDHSKILNRINAIKFKFTNYVRFSKYYIHSISNCNFYLSYIGYILSVPLKTSVFNKIEDLFVTVPNFNIEGNLDE